MSDEELRILCVDDEPNVLQGLERSLGFDYDVVTALGGEAALRLMREEGPFAVTISDMRMPNMDGATYLARVAEESPDTVRMLLTGYSETEAAIRAINEGRIFRFLMKPCEADALRQAVNDALAQHRLITSERQLLQGTLFGCIKVMTELLTLVNPVAFNRACLLNAVVVQLANQLHLQDEWRIELVVMLLHLGCVSVPPKVLQRAYVGEELSAEEQRKLQGVPRTALNLLEGIPRLEDTLEALSLLTQAPKPPEPSERLGTDSPIWIAHIIQATQEAARIVPRLASPGEIATILNQRGWVHPAVANAFHRVTFPAGLLRPDKAGRRWKEMEIPITQLKEGMQLLQDATSESGVLFVKGGQMVTSTVLRMISQLARQGELAGTLRVSVEVS